MRLLIDEMWPPAVAAQLRGRGYDAVAVLESPALQGKADAIVFAAAQAEGRAIMTENVPDFRPLAAAAFQQGRSHDGLIFTSNQRFPRHDPRTLGRIITALDELLSTGVELTNRECWLT